MPHYIDTNAQLVVFMRPHREKWLDLVISTAVKGFCVFAFVSFVFFVIFFFFLRFLLALMRETVTA